MKLPESILTDKPKEAIAFCIAYGIEQDILPKDFKMSQEGFDILEGALSGIWGKHDDELLNQIMIAFIAGYATGTKQVNYKS